MNPRAVLVSLIDQGVVSLTTIGLSLGLIVLGTPAAFGQFTFMLMLVLVAASLHHGLIGIHILVTVRADPDDAGRAALVTLGGCDLVYRAAASLAVMVLALLVTADPLTLAAAGLFAWSYLWRETARNILFAREDGPRALLIDGLALAGTAALYALFVQSSAQAWTPLLAAGLATAAALALFGRDLSGAGTAPLFAPVETVRRFVARFGQSGWTVLDSAANEVQMRGYVAIVEAFRGAAQLGVLEAGRVLWGPLVLFVSAWRRVAQPHLTALLERDAIWPARTLAFGGVGAGIVIAGLYAGVIALFWPLIETHLFQGAFEAATGFVVGWGVYTLVLISNWMLAIFLNAARRFRMVATVTLSAAAASIAVLAVLAFGADLIAVIHGMIAIQCAVFAVLSTLVLTTGTPGAQAGRERLA